MSAGAGSRCGVAKMSTSSVTRRFNSVSPSLLPKKKSCRCSAVKKIDHHGHRVGKMSPGARKVELQFSCRASLPQQMVHGRISRLAVGPFSPLCNNVAPQARLVKSNPATTSIGQTQIKSVFQHRCRSSRIAGDRATCAGTRIKHMDTVP